MCDWHKIDWEKVTRITLMIKPDEEDFWNYLASEAGVELDSDGNLPEDFVWEDGYKAGFPRENGYDYLGYDRLRDEVFVVTFDEEQDYEPCFWDKNGEIVSPDFWAEIEKPDKTLLS